MLACRETVKYGGYEMKTVPDPSGTQLQVEHTTVFGPGNITFYPPGRLAYTSMDPWIHDCLHYRPEASSQPIERVCSLEGILHAVICHY